MPWDGRRLAAARERAKLGVNELNDRLGVSSGTVSKWISNARNPSLEHIEQLARILGVSAGWLAFGEGSMEGPTSAKPPPEVARLEARVEALERQLQATTDTPCPPTTAVLLKR